MIGPKNKIIALWFFFAISAAVWSLRFCNFAPACPLDDAYIHFRYASNLADGAGFSFNNGEPSFGTTSPLWVILLASLINRVDPVWLARVISYVSLVAVMIFASLFVKESRGKELAPDPGVNFSENRQESHLLGYASLAALLVLFSGNFSWIAYSGMESALWAALTMAAIYFSIREKPAWLGYIFLGLAVLCRFEAVLFIPIVLAWQFLRTKGRLKIFAGALAAVLIGCSFYIYAYFRIGEFFPTTMAGKLASDLFNSGMSIKGGWVFLVRHLHYLYAAEPFALLGLSLVMIGSLIWLFSGAPKKREIGRPGMLALFAFFIFIFHDQFFRSTAVITPYQNMRYQALFFPALAIGVIIVLVQLLGLLKNSRLRAVPVALVLIILIGSIYWGGWKWNKLYAGQCRHIGDVHIAAAKWARDITNKDARIACFDIGSLGYFSDRYVIDLGGLIDPEAHPYLREKRMGPYLKTKQATHYIELGTPGSERLMGVRQDLGKLYEMAQVAEFAGQRVPEPVLLHSWEMKVFEIRWMQNQNIK